MHLEPIRDQKPSPEDPFYRLADLAADRGRSLTNEQMDGIIYRARPPR